MAILVNGAAVDAPTDPRVSLLDLPRERLQPLTLDKVLG
jgi:hypothetical protein